MDKKTSALKVLLVEPRGIFGNCHYTYNLGQALAQAGCEVVLLTSSPYELEPFERAFKLEAFPLRTFKGIADAIKMAKRFKADVVHMQGANNRPAFERAFLKLLKMTAKRAIYTCHVAVPHEPRQIEMRFIGSKMRDCDLVIVHSDRTWDEVENIFKVPRAKLRQLPHGDFRFFARFPRNPKLDAEIEAAFPADAKVILAFGMIREYKGYNYMIESVGILRKKGLDVRLMVVGKPNEPWEKYEKLCQENGILDAVWTKLDYVDMADVPSFFARPDLVCLPYLSGSDSGVLQLASAFNKPIVATDVGGNKDAFEEGQVAAIVPPADAASLADALEAVLFNPTSLDEEKLAASRDRRDWTNIARSTIDLYHEVLSK